MTALPAAIAARAVKVAVAAETVAAAAVTGAVAATTVVRAVKVVAAVREPKAPVNLGVNPVAIVARGASATAEATRDLRPSSRLHS